MQKIDVTSIIGTWRLVAATARDENNVPLPLPYGPTPTGVIMFDENRRMLCVVCDGRSEIPAGEVRAYTSYGGKFTLQGSKLTTRLDLALDPQRIGSDQVREVSFREGRLVIVNTRAMNVQRELVWQKLKPDNPA